MARNHDTETQTTTDDHPLGEMAEPAVVPDSPESPQEGQQTAETSDAATEPSPSTGPTEGELRAILAGMHREIRSAAMTLDPTMRSLLSCIAAQDRALSTAAMGTEKLAELLLPDEEAPAARETEAI